MERQKGVTGSLLCVTHPQSKQHGGDARKPTVSTGELDVATEGYLPSGRTNI